MRLCPNLFSVDISSRQVHPPELRSSRSVLTARVPEVAHDLWHKLLNMQHSFWPSFESRAKTARWGIKFGEKRWHYSWCYKWCHSFRQIFWTHLATKTNLSKFQLVRRPESVSVFSLCLYLLLTRAGVSIQLRRMLRHIEITALRSLIIRGRSTQCAS